MKNLTLKMLQMNYIYVLPNIDNYKFYKDPTEKLIKSKKLVKIGVDDIDMEKINLMVRLRFDDGYFIIYHIEESSLASFTEKFFRCYNDYESDGTFSNEEKRLSLECRGDLWILYKNLSVVVEDIDYEDEI